MPIPASMPTTLSGEFSNWAFEFRTIGDGLLPYGSPRGGQPPIAAVAKLTKFRVRDDGVSERSPSPEDSITVAIADLYAEAATNPVVASALTSMIEAVSSIAVSQGKL